MSDLSVLIPTRNRPVALSHLCQQMTEYAHGYDVEVLVETGEATLPKKFNAMVRRATAPLMFFANDDLVLQPYTLANMIMSMRSFLDTVGMGLVFFSEATRRCSVCLILGQLFVMRRAAGDAIGWCDERFLHQFSDIDLMWKLKEHQYTILPLPGVCCHHLRIDDPDRHEREAWFQQDQEAFGKKWVHRKDVIATWFPDARTGLQLACPIHYDAAWTPHQSVEMSKGGRR